MKARDSIILLTIFFLLLVPIRVFADNEFLSKDYLMNYENNFPEILNVGTKLECGNYEIQLMAQPVVTKSSNTLIADLDLKYLVVRIGITNKSEETIGWLTKESFQVQETYMNHAYGTYGLDMVMSAKASVGYSQPVFYSPVEPGKMMQTTLVFEVFPEAQGWIFTFNPNTLGSEKNNDMVQFQLPKALMQ